MIQSNPILTFLNTYGKVLFLIVTMILGALLPQAGTLSFLVQYLLLGMLFFAFLDIEISPRSFQKGIAAVLLANVAVAFAAFWAFSFIDPNLGIVAFVTAIAPTAISSTVIVSLLHRQVDFMVAAVLVTNIIIALIVPIALPVVLGKEASISTLDVLSPVLITMFVPLILARLARYLPAPVYRGIQAGKSLSLPLWIMNLFIVSAKASSYLQNEGSASLSFLVQIALVTLVICIANFGVGALIGGHKYWQETSQALGQKNNSFAIWLALTFVNPLAAMGPTFYIIYHNLYNTWQIYRHIQKTEKNKDVTLSQVKSITREVNPGSTVKGP